MKNIFLLLLVLNIFTLSAQKTVEKEFKLSNGKSKKVKIYIPKDYETDTIHKYPVMVVLNDQYLFDITKGNAKLYADTDLAPKQIVVGIPTDLDENQDVSIISKNLGLTRNSKIFFNFIKKNLLTYLKTTYKTSPFVSIVGQGKAANFLLHFLSENNVTFNAYICINPELSEQVNAQIESYNLKRFDKIDNTYFLYVSGNPYQNKKIQTSFINLETGLSSYELKNLNTEFDDFKDTPNSLSSISEGIPRAFSFIFKLFRNISKSEFEEKIKGLAPLDAIEYLEKKYIDIDYLYGTNTNVRLEDFYAIEPIVMDQQGGDYLRVLGDFAMIKHPNSPLGEFYMGKFYELGKDYEKANDYYKFGYGKMDPSDPSADAFYQNIARIKKLMDALPQPKPDEALPPLDGTPEEEENTTPPEEEQNNKDGE